MNPRNSKLEIFSTCPRSDRLVSGSEYLRQVQEVSRWSEEIGCKGALVYSDNSMVDPWIVSTKILESTTNFSPLVAVQPVYMHPYSAAKIVATLGHLYGRKVYLNMVAGGFASDLSTLNDTTPHDKRYTRLTEYTFLILELLKGPSPVTFEGQFYRVDKLKMTPAPVPGLLPGVFVSGSSESGLQAARAIGAVAVKYPTPPNECAADPPPNDLTCGIRLGIIARSEEEEAWGVAEKRFPEDRRGELAHGLAMKTSESLWHRQLSMTAEKIRTDRTPYWLRPFERYQTFCPYLVGSYNVVAQELARYITLGYETFILDIPPSAEELKHTFVAFEKAEKLAERAQCVR